MQTSANNVLVDSHNNFINITQLKDMDSIEGQKTFLVPYEGFGKLFDNGSFIHSTDENYEVLSDVSVKYTTDSTDDNESWIHVNANKIFNIEKRLIKIDKTGNEPYRIYGLFDNNTEFYYLDENGYGTAMIPYKSSFNSFDYKPFDKGIDIISEKAKAANYIYAISYVFQDTPRAGKVIKKDFTIGAESEVYVGQLTKRPMVFLDGLYLEQSKYNYDSTTGKVQINDEVINPMDMMAVVFEDFEATGEKEINNITESNGKDTLVGTFTNAVNFKKPLAFVSGVMGTNIISPTEIEFIDTSLLIKNFGPDVVSPSKVMVVEADNMYICHGELDKTATIKHEDITGNANDEYLLFIDGILISSSHLDIAEGEVRIANGIEGQQFVLLKIKDKATTSLCFDNKIQNFTVSIVNKDGTLYNECNNALIFADGKSITTEDTIFRAIKPLRGSTGQIIKVKNTNDDSNTVYEYCIWNDNDSTWDVLSDSEEIKLIESFMIGSYTNGSIMLDSTNLENKQGTYYAYTFANGVEEPLLKGKINLIDEQIEYSVNIEDKFNINQGALSVYVDKLLSPFMQEEGSNIGKFILPELEHDEDDVNPYRESEAVYYVERPEKTELTSCQRQVLTAKDRNTDYIGAYNTTISLLPGVVSVYVNGVRLEKRDYSIVNENTIIIHNQIVGNQNNYDAEDKTTWNKYEVYSKDKVIEIDCKRDDYIIVEVRQDYNLKSQTIPVRYAGQRTYYIEDDGIPKSLLLTQDLIKIYIDGVIYTGEYSINKENGSITLLDVELESILNVDPIARYFDLNPDAYDKYIEDNGEVYIAKPKINRITFEWR